MMTVDNDYMCLYDNLMDAGYMVLTFDFRGHGESQAPATGTVGNGHHEWQDVAAVMEWALKSGGKQIE
jgi:alpha/beta superfamily hydrolase